MSTNPVVEAGGSMRMVLVVDDHPLYGQALAASLGHLFPDSMVLTVPTLAAALHRLKAVPAVDLVLLDLRLPDSMGISGLLKVREAAPDTPVVIVSALRTAEVMSSAMSAGAAGFVPKDAPISELEAALAAVADGRRAFPRGVSAESPARNAGKGGPAPSVAERLALLTPQHARIMRLICEGKQNKQIAYELSLAEATVKAHITALLRRLGVQNRTQAAVLAESVWLAEAEADPGADAGRRTSAIS
jgi:DNA-binding NarL/FixJ family response regulator